MARQCSVQHSSLDVEGQEIRLKGASIEQITPDTADEIIEAAPKTADQLPEAIGARDAQGVGAGFPRGLLGKQGAPWLTET